MAALVALSASAMATNQPLPWNGPCTTMTVVNFTSCASTITMNLYGGGTYPVTVPAGGTVTVFPPVMSILGVKTVGMNSIPIDLTPHFPPGTPVLTPPLNTSPSNGYIQAATTGSGCCVDIYFYTTNNPNYPCHVFLYPPTAPCVP
jgi:hypothetical protein